MDDTFFIHPKWYYVGREDDQIHGPFSSQDMQTWLQHQYFHDNLQLKTDRDDQFYSLAEWTRACGNQNPFLVPIGSMDSLITQRMNMHNNNLSFQRVPSVPVSACFSLSGTPSSTPTPAFGGGGGGGGVPEHQGSHLAGLPFQVVKPTPGGQILLMNAGPPPPPAPGIIRVSNSQSGHPLFSPPSQQISLVPVSSIAPAPASASATIYHQFVGGQQQRGTSFHHHLLTTPFVPRFPPPPLPPLHQQQQIMQNANNGGGSSTESQRVETASSDSPDSGNMVTPYGQCEKSADTTDAPWNSGGIMVDKCVGSETTPSAQRSEYVQTDAVEITAHEAEKQISQLLGIRVVINR